MKSHVRTEWLLLGSSCDRTKQNVVFVFRGLGNTHSPVMYDDHSVRAFSWRLLGQMPFGDKNLPGFNPVHRVRLKLLSSTSKSSSTF